MSTRSAGLLTGLRLAYGATLLAAPGHAVQAATGHPADTRARRVTRLLGARHLLQGIGTVGRPGPDVLGLGAEVDLVHSATALALGVLDGRRRRAGLVDAAVAGSFAVAGLAVTRDAVRRPPPAPATPAGVMRADVAAPVAAILLPQRVTAR